MAHDNENMPQPHVHAVPLNPTRRLWRITVPMGLCLSIAGAFAGWKLFVPNYSASAYLRIDSENRPLFSKTADTSLGNGTDFNLYRNTQAQLIKTPFVLNAALRDQKISSLQVITEQNDALQYLAERLTVIFPGDGELMQVSYSSTDAPSAISIVNAVVNAYMDEVVVNERHDQLARLKDLESVRDESEAKVRDKRSKLRSFAVSLGTDESDSLTLAQKAALLRYDNLTEKLREIQFEIMQAEGEMKIAVDFDRRRKEADMPSDSTDASQPMDESMAKEEARATPILAERSSDVVQLEDEIGSAKSKLNSLSDEFGPTHAVVGLLKEAIEDKVQLLELRKQVDQQRTALRMLGGINFDLGALAVRRQVLANQEKILQEQVDTLATETRRMGTVSIDMELMRSEISIAEDVLRRVGEEIEHTLIELKRSSRINVLSPAVTASPPDLSRRWIAAIALGGLGLVVPFGLFALLDLVRKRVRNENL
jgi:hypothetical protein